MQGWVDLDIKGHIIQENKNQNYKHFKNSAKSTSMIARLKQVLC